MNICLHCKRVYVHIGTYWAHFYSQRDVINIHYTNIMVDQSKSLAEKTWFLTNFRIIYND